MKFAHLFLCLAACGPIAAEPEVSSTTTATTTGLMSSSSTGEPDPTPADLGMLDPDLPTVEPVDTDRNLLVFITSDTYRGDTMPFHGMTPDEICTWHGARIDETKSWRAWASMDGDSPALLLQARAAAARRPLAMPVARIAQVASDTHHPEQVHRRDVQAGHARDVA